MSAAAPTPAAPGRRRRGPAAVLATVAVLVLAVSLVGCGRFRHRLSTPTTVSSPTTTVAAAPGTTAATTPTTGPGADPGAVAAQEKQAEQLDSSLAALDSQLDDMGKQLSKSTDTTEPDPAN